MTDTLVSYPLNEPTYARIKRAIISDFLSRVFAPGAHITIDMLTSRYKVSHMPVREALRQLEGEGVLTSSAHKGFRFEAITEDYIRNIFDIRLGIESMLARRAVERAKPGDIDDMVLIHERFVEDLKAEDPALASRTNIEFHRRLYGLAGNPEAEQMLEGRTLVARTFGLSFGGYRLADRPGILREHERIMVSIVAREPERCGLAVFDHLIAARDRLLDRMIESRFLEK